MSIINVLLVLSGNIYYDLILFGNTIIGFITDIDITLKTSNIFITTYERLNNAAFPFMYHSLNVGGMVATDIGNYFDYYKTLLSVSSYGIISLVLEFALSIGAIFFALKFASKIARMIKDLVNPLN